MAGCAGAASVVAGVEGASVVVGAAAGISVVVGVGGVSVVVGDEEGDSVGVYMTTTVEVCTSSVGAEIEEMELMITITRHARGAHLAGHRKRRRKTCRRRWRRGHMMMASTPMASL